MPPSLEVGVGDICGLPSFLVPRNCAGGLPHLNLVDELEGTEARVIFAHDYSAPACGLNPPSGCLSVAPAFAINTDRLSIYSY